MYFCIYSRIHARNVPIKEISKIFFLMNLFCESIATEVIHKIDKMKNIKR